MLLSRKVYKKILIIALADSIHTKRWIRQLSCSGLKIYVFPSMETNQVHISQEEGITCIPFLLKYRKSVFHKVFYRIYSELLGRVRPDYYKRRLAKYIRKIKPDIIHTLETQNAGYLMFSVVNATDRSSYKWWHTNWGSDIYLFGRLPSHKDRIRNVLSSCDYYSAECNRDIELARKFGFKGHTFPVYPNTGGFHINELESLRLTDIKTSRRKVIALKGYQGWAGRCFVAFEALKRIKEQLKGYTLVVYTSVGYPVELAAELFRQDAGIEVVVHPQGLSHEEVLKIHGQARISIGLSISDAISTSVLEAMAMGSFPVQSWTSAADEWFDDGKTGILVPPEDPQLIAAAIDRALHDDNLVDTAAEKNWNTIKERLEYEKIRKMTISSYEKIMKDIEEGREEL